jgi:hypothetical protein
MAKSRVSEFPVTPMLNAAIERLTAVKHRLVRPLQALQSTMSDFARVQLSDLDRFWVLTREGGPVKRIYTADPRPQEKGGKPCQEPELLWERGVDEIEPKDWVCPVTGEE